VQDPDELFEVIGGHELPADQAAVRLLELKDGAGPQAEAIPQALRDRDLALLADGRFHTDMVRMSYPVVKNGALWASAAPGSCVRA
jgi:hypothetical protein